MTLTADSVEYSAATPVGSRPMTVTPTSRTVALDPSRNVPGVRRPAFRTPLRAEWIKFWTVRSTTWSTVMLFVLGAGLTVLVCATSAEWLASGKADESPGSFVTWGMMIAQITAVVLGALVVTSEYGTGMIRATLAATPRRGAVLAAKALVLSSTLFVVGTVTAFAGYLGGNWFLDEHGVGVALTDDGVLRAMFGSGLYLAGARPVRRRRRGAGAAHRGGALDRARRWSSSSATWSSCCPAPGASGSPS